MAIQRQQQQSMVEIKINFQKSAEMISKMRSKASHRIVGNNEYSVVCEIVDGMNLMVDLTGKGLEDRTNMLVGCTANLRLSKEQFDILNAELHEVEGVGASVTYELTDYVRSGFLDTKKDGRVISFTIYPDSLVEVEPVVVQKVGSAISEEDFMQGIKEMKERQEQNRQQAVQTRVARQSADAANADVAAPIFG